jgi:hypothetical protein
LSASFAGSNVKRSTTCNAPLCGRRPSADRMPGAKPTVSTVSTSFSQRPIECPATLGADAGGMLALIEMDRALDAHRAVEHLDLGRALRDPVDVGFERPVEQDVRRPAVEARIIGGREIQSRDCGGARGRERQLAAALVPVGIDRILRERHGGAARARERLAAGRHVARRYRSSRSRAARACPSGRAGPSSLAARRPNRQRCSDRRSRAAPADLCGRRARPCRRELPLAVAVEAAASAKLAVLR